VTNEEVFSGAHECGQSVHKRPVLVCVDNIYDPRELPGVSTTGPGIGWGVTSSNSCSCFFNSVNSAGGILYRLLDIGAVPGCNSTANSMSRSGGILGNSSRKTSRYSQTTGILSKGDSIMENLGWEDIR
jgi:hypothetical protein